MSFVTLQCYRSNDRHFAGSGSIIFFMDPDTDLNLAHHQSPPPSHLIFHPPPSHLLPHPSSLNPHPLLPHPSSFNPSTFLPHTSSLIPNPSTLLPQLSFIITHISSLIPQTPKDFIDSRFLRPKLRPYEIKDDLQKKLPKKIYIAKKGKF